MEHVRGRKGIKSRRKSTTKKKNPESSLLGYNI
jgi:hypothetical protein